MVKTKCEVYSRVVGYIRPVEQWHDGKQAEFVDRNKFVLKGGVGRVESVKKEKVADEISQTRL